MEIWEIWPEKRLTSVFNCGRIQLSIIMLSCEGTMTPQALQRRMGKYLEAVGIEPDMMDSYGSLLIFRKLVGANDGKESAKWYAWQIFEKVPGCRVFDFYEAWFNGKEYYVVRFEAPDPLPSAPVVCRKEAGVQPRVKAVRRVVAKPAARAEVRMEPAAVVVEEPKRPTVVEVTAPVVKREIEGLGSYVEKLVEPMVGQVAWTIVGKKGGGQQKQARCEVMALTPNPSPRGRGGLMVEVRLTKTGQKLQVGLERLFDHVPHQKAGGVWK